MSTLDAEEHIDTITLGAGGGAYPAGFALARAGKRVVMVDTKGVMSGNCLAEGCVPSKSVYEMTGLRRRMSASAPTRAFGPPGEAIDYSGIVAWKDAVQQTRYDQHSRELESIRAFLELVQGTARLVDAHRVEVTTATHGRPRTFFADQVIIATGADVLVPPIPGAELCVTSRDLFALHPSVTTLPRRLAVIGGGYIGLEVACMLRALGSEVTVIHRRPQLLSGMDPDFVSLLAAGIDPAITVHLSSSATEVVKQDNGALTVRYSDNATEDSVEADLVLMAVGRRPVIPEGAGDLGLTMAGHALAVEPSMQVPGNPHIYAPGDVNGRSMLFHSAVRQSLVAAHNILAGNQVVDRMDFDDVPTTIFTAPEGAYVGLTRSAAAQRHVEVVEGSYQLQGDARAQILGETYGEIRLFCEAGSLRLVGGWVVGVDAAQLIGQIGEAVAAGLTAYDLARFADQHPTAAEGIGKAARTLAG